MDVLTFITKMTDSLVWPSAVILIVFLLRKPLIELLPFLEELKYKDFALKFSKEVSKAKEKISFEIKEIKDLPNFNKEKNSLLKLLKHSPRKAVVESWSALQDTLLKISFEKGEIDNIENFREHSRMGHVMLHINIFNKEDFHIYHKLRELRNKAIHMPDFIINIEDAKDFVGLATQLSFIAKARVSETT